MASSSVVPNNREDMLKFYQNHVNPWLSNATQIGLTNQQATGFRDAVEAATAAFAAAEAARQASKTATQAYYQATADLRANGGDVLQIIRTFAVTSGNPNVYTLAEIPPPKNPSSQPAPKAPINITGSLSLNGELTLRWRLPTGSPEGGNFYMVERRIQESASSGFTPWTLVGANGRRDFIDPAFPACVTSVQYRVRTQRSGQTSEWAPSFTVLFTSGGGPTFRFEGDQADQSDGGSQDQPTRLAA